MKWILLLTHSLLMILFDKLIRVTLRLNVEYHTGTRLCSIPQCVGKQDLPQSNGALTCCETEIQHRSNHHHVLQWHQADPVLFIFPEQYSCGTGTDYCCSCSYLPTSRNLNFRGVRNWFQHDSFFWLLKLLSIISNSILSICYESFLPALLTYEIFLSTLTG